MSLLRQEEQDDAARGEELTKGSTHLVWASIIAVIVVSVAIAAYVISGQKPPAATGQVLAVWAHPQVTQTTGFDANGVAIPQETIDQVMVFARVRLHNQSKGPLLLSNILTNATLEDGIHSSYAAPASEYNRIFLAYPGMPVPHGTPLALDTEIDPDQTVEGTFVSAFKLSKAQWEARKALNFTFAFHYQPNLVLTPDVPVTEQ